MKTSGMNFIKYLLFVFNLMFALTGIIIIAIGMTVQSLYYDYEHFLEDKFFSPPVMLIAVGVLVFFVAFFGCFGAIRESTCMVMVFSFFLSLIFILEFSAGIAGFVMQSDLQLILHRRMDHALHRYETRKDYHDAWNLIQKELQCCGVDGPADWDDINVSLPNSCCFNYNQTDCILYVEGCLPKLESLVSNSGATLAGIAILFGLVQFFGVFFSCFLGRAIRRQKRENILRREQLRETLTNSYKLLGSTDPKYTYPLYMDTNRKF